MFIGGLDDQINLIVWSLISKPFFSFVNDIFSSSEALNATFLAYLRPLDSNEPLVWLFISMFASLVGYWSNNIFVLLTLILNLYFGYSFFKKFKYGIVFSLIFTFSSYFWLHLGKHPDLGFVWLLPIAAKKLDGDFSYSTKDTLILALYAFLLSLISNYLGFFLVLFIILFALCDLLLKMQRMKTVVKFCAIFLTSYLLLIVMALMPYIKINYFNASPQGYINPLNRSFDDLVSFSSRPWYHFIPSPKNPIYKEFSQSLISKLEDTKYFLADDYFQGEHDSMFFGYFFLAAYLAIVIYNLREEDKLKNNRDVVTHHKYLLLGFLLFLFTLPPFFTVFGQTVFTPSYVLFKIVPFFRVTSRLSIFILLAVILSFIYGLKNITFRNTRVFSFLMIVLLAVTLVESYVPVKIYKNEGTPAVYKYLGQAPTFDKFVVYPYSMTKEALYFLPEHKKDLLNIRGFKNAAYESQSLTEGLVTDAGLSRIGDLGVHYLLVFKSVSVEDLTYFSTNRRLELEKEFDDSYLYSLTE